MTKYRVVPVELLKSCMRLANVQGPTLLRRHLCDLLAAAPVPPAGGEPEVERFTDTHQWRDQYGIKEQELLCVSAEDFDAHVTRLQADVERLNSRIEEFEVEASVTQNALDEKDYAIKTLQSGLEAERKEHAVTEAIAEKHELRANEYASELTKARELLHKYWTNASVCSFASKDIGEFLAHQSVPAAKCATCGEPTRFGKPFCEDHCYEQTMPAAKLESWPCWSCKTHVTLANRADANGNCPHCEAELDLEDWPSQPTKDGES